VVVVVGGLCRHATPSDDSRPSPTAKHQPTEAAAAAAAGPSALTQSKQRVQDGRFSQRGGLIGQPPEQQPHADVTPELRAAEEEREGPVAQHAHAARQPRGQHQLQLVRQRVEVQRVGVGHEEQRKRGEERGKPADDAVEQRRARHALAGPAVGHQEQQRRRQHRPPAAVMTSVSLRESRMVLTNDRQKKSDSMGTKRRHSPLTRLM